MSLSLRVATLAFLVAACSGDAPEPTAIAPAPADLAGTEARREHTAAHAPPLATADTGRTAEDTALVTAAPGVLANDSDPHGEPLRAVLANGPANGTVVLETDGSYTYTPASNFAGTDSFTYRAENATHASSPATVSITVTAVNDAPVNTVPGPQTTDEDTTLELPGLATSDIDAGGAVVQVTLAATNGRVSIRTTGLTFSVGDGTADPVMVFSGVLGQLNAALATVTFTPNPNFGGNAALAMTTNDRANTGSGGARSDTDNIAITVVPVNDPPIANPDAVTIAEDAAPRAIDVRANDSTAPETGETITVIAVTQPAGGTVVITGGGTGLTFQPAPDANGIIPFTYTISDGRGGTATATVTVTVTPVDDPPIARDDAITVAEDAAATAIDVRANDLDVDGDVLIITAVTQPASGAVVITDAGAGLTFQPAPEFHGVTAFGYTISDGTVTRTATVAVTVTPVNDLPVANLELVTVAEDAPATVIDVLANDSTGPDVGEVLAVAAVTQPGRGTVVITGGGTGVSFQPAANANGTEAFTYTISDGNGGTATATVTVNVTPVDDPPTATDDALTVAEDADATAIDVLANDLDVDGDAVTITAVTQPARGTVVLSGGGLTFQPAADATGVVTFTYTIDDGTGLTDTAMVAVTVTPVNDVPTASDDVATVAEDAAATAIDVLANDADRDGDALVVTAVTQPAGGTVVITGGGLTFQPAADATGAMTFAYTVSDGQGGIATAQVTVTVTAASDAPVATDDAATVAEDAAATAIDVLANDRDVDGDPLAVTAVTQPARGTVVVTGSGLTFQPAPDATGIDTFTYTIGDGTGETATATVTVVVTPVNDAPTVADDTATVAEDAAATVLDVLGNDTDVDGDALAVTAVTQPATGTVLIVSGGTGVSFQPAADATAPVTFTYTASDGSGGTATATVTVAITAVNDAPTANEDVATVAEDAAATAIDVLANDTDRDGDAVTITAVTQPTTGAVTITGGGTGLSFQPAANAHGTAAFTYTIDDGSGGTASATVTVAITPVNDAPTARDDDAVVAEDAAATTIDVLANDADLDGDALAVTAVTPPATGTAVIIGGGTGVSFQPAADATGPVAFTYTVSDGNGGTATAAVTVTVTPVNDAPVATDDLATVAEDAAATAIDVLANDTDSDGDAVVITAVTQPTTGTVVITGGGTGLGFRPAADATGTVTFTYSIDDGHGGTATATTTVVVTPVNDPPIANEDVVTVPEDAAATALDVLANDTDIDGDALRITAVSPPASGTAAITGGGRGVTFQPAANASGTTTFTYTVDDGHGGTATATVTVSVIASNDAPTALDDSATMAEDAAATAIDVLANDGDLDGDPLAITAVTQPARGTVVVAAGGLTFQPAANATGVDTFTYTVGDASGATATATVTVTVTPVNDPPTAGDDTATMPEDAAATAIDVLANDADLDGDALAVTAVTQPATGTVAVTAAGLTFEPAADASGTVTFTYVVSDGNGATATASVTVVVVEVNDPPTARDDSATVAEDAAATALDVLGNDTDLDGDAVVITAVTQPIRGTVVITGGGTGLSFQPAANASGIVTFTYTVSDGNGGTATATATVTVSPVNDAPIARDDAATVAEDADAIVIDVLANDLDVDGDALTITAVSQPASGTVEFTTDGVSFRPGADATGPVTFTYAVRDGSGETATATVTVTVTPVNDPPIARDDSATVTEDAAATAIDVLANDATGPDAGETLAITAVTQPASGTVVVTGAGLTFQPAADAHGTVTFTYTIDDGNGGTATAAVTVTVAPVNDAPFARDDATIAANAGPVVIDVLANDGDVDGDLRGIASVTQPANGWVTLVDGGTRLSVAPAAGATGLVTFDYTIIDSQDATATATVTVTLTHVNTPPTAQGDFFIVGEGAGPTVLDVLANDSTAPDVGETLTITAVTQPAEGTLVITDRGTGLTFEPATGATGLAMFSYDISDGRGGAASATVLILLMDINDPPIANDDVATMNEDDDAILIDVLANDSTGPDQDELLMVTEVTQPTSGTAVITIFGVTYQPPADFHGVATFGYTISDGNGGTASATVTVRVASRNDRPLAVSDVASVDPGQVVMIEVRANDLGLGDGPITITATRPAHGTVSVDREGIVTYVTEGGYQGRDELAYTLTDADGETSTARIVIAVGLDSDQDGLPDFDELGLGIDPFDADSDDDGSLDGLELLPGKDIDRDGLVNALDPDSDGDGINDGTELGVTTPDLDTDVDQGQFVPDADPWTVTDALAADSDGGGRIDGDEDLDRDGAVGVGERDPNDAADDDRELSQRLRPATRSTCSSAAASDPCDAAADADPDTADTDDAGGCSTGGDVGGGAALALALALVAIRRRRR